MQEHMQQGDVSRLGLRWENRISCSKLKSVGISVGKRRRQRQRVHLLLGGSDHGVEYLKAPYPQFKTICENVGSIGHRSCKRIVKQHPCCTNLCAFRCLKWALFCQIQIFEGEITSFSETTLLQREPFLTMFHTALHCSLPCKLLC